MTKRAEQGVLFERDGFRVTACGLTVRGRPTLVQWGKALEAVVRGKSGTSWAIGDLLVYSDTRGWDDGEVESLMDQTGLSRGTLMNLKGVSKKFPLERRRPELPWSHHQLVASLEEEEGNEVLSAAIQQAWGYDEVEAQARDRRHRRAQRQMMLFPEGQYGLLVAAPPWQREQVVEQVAWDVDRIASLAAEVQKITAPDAVMYLRTPTQQVEDGLLVLKQWGFRFRGSHVAVQANSVAVSDWMRIRHWHWLVGTKGRFAPPAQPPDSVLHEHESVLERLEEAYGRTVPRVILFANASPREGWVAWSHEVPVETEAARSIRVRHEEVPA